MPEPILRLGVVIDDESVLGAAGSNDPVDVVVLRSTFLNPPRAGAARRIAERIREHHPSGVELVPYAWHYLTHEADDGVAVGSNRSLDAGHGRYGHFRGEASEHAWEITRICATALDAERVLIRTPSSFSPGSLSRRRFTHFVESLGPEDPKLVWEPEGLWSTAAAAAFAEPLGVEVLGLAQTTTGAPIELDGASWVRVQAGKDGRLHSSHAEVLAYTLVASLAEQSELTVLFDGRRAYANLRSFADALALV